MTMTTEQINKNPFLGKTGTTPRPSHDPAKDGPFGPIGRESLARDQRAWDAARSWDLDNQTRRSDFLAGIDQQREAARQSRVDEAEARHVDALRKRYMSVPGSTEEQFQEDLPRIQREARIAAALEVPTISNDIGGIPRARYRI